MALAFQRMLERFGLTEKIHAVNADNATADDKQMTKLDSLNNSFEAANHVRCFNHTLQLSAKALLAPFNPAISRKATRDDEMSEGDDDDLLLPEHEEEDSEEDGEEDSKEDVKEDEKDDEDDDINELGELSEDERAKVLEDTAGVRETVTKVCRCKAYVRFL